MAVQDGYGKSSGSESLVFAYDLKDTINSFRGQPATNIWLSGNPSGQGSGVQIIQTNYFLGKVIDSGVVYRNYVTNPAQSDTGTYYNNGGLNIGSMSFSNLNPSTRYIQISFDYYGVTPYRRFCCSGTGLNGYMGITYTDSSTDTYGWDTTYSPGSGDDWNNDSARMGYWQKVSLIVALNPSKTPSNIWALYIYMDAATQGEGYFANIIFTEHSTYPTGPIRWTSGTRSNTQGLLDLTGNSSINLSDVSFDSNSQLTFDGTNDKITINCTGLGVNTYNSTTEFIIQLPYYSGGQRCIMSYRGNSGGDLYIGKGSNGIFSYYNSLSNPAYTVGYIADGAIAHVAVVCDAANNLIKHYINGSLTGSASRTGWISSNHTSFTLGYDPGGTNEYMDGKMYKFAHYNRVLTTTEIANNYLKYKRQYGLT